MVVPAIGVVVGDDHRGVLPVRLLLQEVDDVDDEGLLVQRIGVAGVAVLVAGRLEEADGREIAGVDRIVEVMHVVLVVCAVTVAADLCAEVGRVCSGWRSRRSTGRLVVRNVVRLLDIGDGRGGGALAAGGAVGVHRRQIEAALEEAPGDTRRVQQIADILAAELHQLAGGGGAHVAHRIRIADQGAAAVAVGDQCCRRWR